MSGLSCFGQDTTYVYVGDSSIRDDALAFATLAVYCNDGSLSYGTTTDENGWAIVPHTFQCKQVTASYVGYEPEVRYLQNHRDTVRIYMGHYPAVYKSVPYETSRQEEWKEIQVAVVDASNLKPIPHALLQVFGYNRGQYSMISTNEQGMAPVRYTAQSYHLRVTVDGFESTHVNIPVGEEQLAISMQLDGKRPHRTVREATRDTVHIPTSRIYAFGNRVWEGYYPPGGHPNSITSIDAKTINRQINTSLAPALNQIPGVQVDERGLGGSRRISIRGSFLRSPFAVRNVKMYWMGFPMTSPDGSSPLDMIEALDVGGLSILKGPVGAVYGAGNGGVLLFSPREFPMGTNLTSETVAGSFGLMKQHSAFSVRDDRSAFRVSHTWQETQGYRNQEWNHKNQVMLNGTWDAGDDVNYLVYASHYNGRWALPGAITLEQAKQDPTQARSFSEDNNAFVQRTRNRIGFGRTQGWAYGRFQNRSYISFNQTDKINPYGTSPFFNGYKDEDAVGYSARSIFSGHFNSPFNRGRLNVTAGTEWQQEVNNLQEWENDGGLPGDFKYDVETLSSSWLVFAHAQQMFNKGFLMVGLSSTGTRYNHEGLRAADSTLASIVQTFRPGVRVLPMILGQYYLPGYAFTASLASGTSNPSLFEMIDPNEGFIQPNLRPENSTNLELSMKSFHNQVRTIVPHGFSAYTMNLNDAILPQGDLFANKGLSRLQGVEAYTGIRIFDKGWADMPPGDIRRITAQPKRVLQLTSRVGIQRFVFQRLDEDISDLNGRFLPGAPRFTWSNELQVSAGHFSLAINHLWRDRTPLDDLNQHWAAAYHLLSARAEYHIRLHFLQISLYGGIQNATNTFYSSFLALNAFGERFYNPSPERNFFGGLKVRLPLSK